MVKHFETLVRHLTEAARILKVGFKIDNDNEEDGFDFTFGDIAFGVGSKMKEVKDYGDKEVYFGIGFKNNPGNRHEPPSCDDFLLKGDDVEKPEHLVGRFLKIHFDEGYNNLMEHLAYLDQPSDPETL